jgi:hypothetical protein
MVDTVLAALKNDSSVNNLVSGRVSWIRPAGAKEYPYITFFEVTNSESQSADDEEYSNDIEIQVDIWTKASTIPITKAVQKVMRGLGFTHQAQADDYSEATQIFHKPIRFMINKEV